MSKPKVFISYGREDSDWARQLAFQLVRLGVEPWIDAFELQAGEDASAKTQKALAESDAFVFIIGNGEPSKNPNLLFEMGAATASGRPVIPVFLGDSSVEKLPTNFSQFVHVKASEPNEAARRIAQIASPLVPAA